MNYSDDKQFDAWRTRARNAMPIISLRVFNLRGKNYAGSGFHYSLEQLLGTCIRDLNDFERAMLCEVEPRKVISQRIVMRLLVTELFKRVVEAERSLKGETRWD